jgi:anti-anti-sigma regulatory factor
MGIEVLDAALLDGVLLGFAPAGVALEVDIVRGGGIGRLQLPSRRDRRFLLILKVCRPIRLTGRKTFVTGEFQEVQIIQDKEHKVLHLRGALGMANGPALRDAALKMSVGPTGADAGGRIHVDMSAVEGADVAALQILAAFDAESARRGRHIEVTGLPITVERQWEAAGWGGFARRNR